MPAADTRVATPLRAPRVGLLSAASLVDLPGVKWGYGAEWYAELPKVAGVAYGARAIKCDPETIDFGADEKAHTNEAYPFSVYGIDWCSTIGSDVRNDRELQRRQGVLGGRDQHCRIADEPLARAHRRHGRVRADSSAEGARCARPDDR
jgi:hypothetical protein